MSAKEIIITIILILILVFSGYYFYNQFLRPEILNSNISLPGFNREDNLTGVSASVSQFYQDMRFNHNQITYFINPNCPHEKISKMKQAFLILEQETNNLLFISASESSADILIGCSEDSYEKEKNIFIAGEGGPTQIINSSQPVVILKGKVLLYNEERSVCDKPILELHELLHVFGYEHINNSDHMMYPYLDCKQELNPELIQHLTALYNEKQYAELLFDQADAYKEKYIGKWYLNFNVSISNQGIINAEQVSLNVLDGGELVKKFDLESIDFGSGTSFQVSNLKLPNNKEVELEIVTTTNEKNKENNVVKLVF